MKKIIYFLALCFFIYSCEDVIEVDVPNAPPRLVIDASLNWFDGTDGSIQTIKLSLSAPFFDNETPIATGAIVTVTNQNNTVFDFIDLNNDGSYICSNFIPQLNEVYSLNIVYDGETYSGQETMTTVTPIDFIEQNSEGGFTGEDIEIKAYYTDPENEENYYFFEFYRNNSNRPTPEVYDDEFINGNQIFAFYADENLEPQDELTIRNYGVSKQFYEFMFLLLQQTEEGGGGPFEVQPATVRGNCINQTNPDNFPFGYFKASQATEFVYVIE